MLCNRRYALKNDKVMSFGVSNLLLSPAFYTCCTGTGSMWPLFLGRPSFVRLCLICDFEINLVGHDRLLL